MPPPDQQNTVNRFDRLLTDLLEEHNGVFIGEYHPAPSMQQAITYLMPSIKNRGVKTISVEVSQATVDSIANSNSLETWVLPRDARRIPTEWLPGLYDTVKAAPRHGIKILGHEDATSFDRYDKQIVEFLKDAYPEKSTYIDSLANNRDKASNHAEYKRAVDEFDEFMWTELDKDTVSREKYYDIAEKISPDLHAGMLARNRFAADYIETNKDPTGKILVIGGARHAHHFYVTRSGKGKDEPENPDLGLDKKLGIPAITYVQHKGALGSVGKTTEVSSAEATYEAILPADLKKFFTTHSITSPAVQHALFQAMPHAKNPQNRTPN